MAFRIIRNDITKVRADAIVNTANPKPVIGGGTDTAIYTAAGKEQLLAARKVIGEIAPGDAVETPAFGLNAKYIIHTVGPVWKGGNDGEFDTLKNCYDNAMKRAKELKCKSIAFPLMAAGSNGFPKDKALQIAMASISEFLIGNEMKVILVVFDDKSFELSGGVINNIRAYVDSHYVEEAEEKEYAMNSREPIFNSVRIESDICESIEGIDIEPVEASFREEFFKIIDARGISGSKVYKDYVSKQVYSKLQCDPNYHPNKSTAVALCLALHLNLDKTQDMLMRAGYVLSPSSKADQVIKGCILNKVWNIVDVDLALYDYGCPQVCDLK